MPLSISIHALREEGDEFFDLPKGTLQNFYPRPPRGGRRAAGESAFQSGEISIHALREEGDAPGRLHQKRPDGISIHALREEGDETAMEEIFKPL